MVDFKSQLTILLAAPDETERKSITEMLEQSNYKVTAVENGKLAKEKLLSDEEKYDIVVLDYFMPLIDGLELMTFMQTNGKLKNIPVIIISASDEIESVATCLNSGAKDYLIKPVKKESLQNLERHVALVKQVSNPLIRGIKILLAVSDETERKNLTEMLEELHYKVTAVENGKIAKDKLLSDEEKYDIVVLDYIMPLIDGLELMTFMQTIEKLKKVPVVIISSSGEMESIATCRNSGAKDYLVKPIKRENLETLQQHVIQGKK